jgi:PilZ domain
MLLNCTWRGASNGPIHREARPYRPPSFTPFIMEINRGARPLSVGKNCWSDWEVHPLVGSCATAYRHHRWWIRPMPLAERRHSRRFQLAVPVLYRWKDATDRYDIGCCRDISATGIFVLSTHCPTMHTEVDVEVVLPASDPLSSEVRLRCKGRVVRIQTRDDLVGFGFAIACPF